MCPTHTIALHMGKLQPRKKGQELAFCLLLFLADDILAKVHGAPDRDGGSSLGYFTGWTISFSQMGYTSEADLDIRSLLPCLPLSSECIWYCWPFSKIWKIFFKPSPADSSFF